MSFLKIKPKKLYSGLSISSLMEEAIKNNEVALSSTGALVADTAPNYGRSPNDKFYVKDDTTADTIWWDGNQAMAPDCFQNLLDDFIDYAAKKDLYLQDLRGGADDSYSCNVRVYNERAWHSLAIKHMLRKSDITGDKFKPDLHIISLPSFRADPKRHGCRSSTVIACDFKRNIVLIAGSSYAGEMKKSVFCFMNYYLPAKKVLPMHCAANIGAKGDGAIFFGLSGTGKTSLSADPDRFLIGDDEHGWSDQSIFNFEGGCYAKTINLSEEHEPEIYRAVNSFGVIWENILLDPVTRAPLFDDSSNTSNARSAYPLNLISNIVHDSKASNLDNIFMLTADAEGILPPIARLSPALAEKFFLLGYTSKIPGTESGITEPVPTFSTCFGAPFVARKPEVYGAMLHDRLAKNPDVNCWLINTGWTGGAYGEGSRMPIALTRALLTAVFNGDLNNCKFIKDEVFGFDFPESINLPDEIFKKGHFTKSVFNPRETWKDKDLFDKRKAKLAGIFADKSKDLS